MTRRPPPVPRTGLPCRKLQRFATADNARAFAYRNDKDAEAVECEHCHGHHVRRPDKAQIEERNQRREAERKARVAAHMSNPQREDRKR